MMRSFISVLALLSAVVGILLATSAVQAQTVVTVDPTPDRAAISLNGASTVTIAWQVARTATPAGTINSGPAQISVGGFGAGTLGTTFSRAFPGAGTQSATFVETLVIPRDLAFRSARSGAPILVSRTFTDIISAVNDTGTVALFPSGPGSEPFSIRRLDLTFDDRSRVRVLSKGSRLRAIAEINTTGSGLIVGQWEIAPATTTSGAPVFRPLALVRQNVAGGRRVFITSPPLPTRFEGTNLVRLNITDPATVFDEPELQYYVTPESPLPERQEPRLLLMTSPSPGIPLTLTTRFAWQAVPGAKAYKLEFYPALPVRDEPPSQDEVVASLPLDPGPDPQPAPAAGPLTGIVLPGAVTETRLKDFTLAHLPAQRRYRWIVTAIGEDGAVLGASAMREIYKP